MSAPHELAAASAARAETAPLIAVEDVTFAYPISGLLDAVPPPSLRDISLQIRRGEYVAVLGHNGSGKSTLARLLNGLLLPASGRVVVDGLDTRAPAARKAIRERVGMVFSDPDDQIIATVVEDDVAWGLAARGRPRAEIELRVAAALEAVGLVNARGRTPHELSGGQRQRLAIAGVLALAPACVVADEPTALLDPQARVEMVGLLRDLHRRRGLTILHVTHLLEEAALADRIIVLEAGRVALDGTPASVFADLERLRALRLVVPPVASLAALLRARGLAVPPEAITPEALMHALEVGA
jgi:energy-coupling factor transport system ATP-binding protein